MQTDSQTETAQPGSLHPVVGPRRSKHRRPTKTEWDKILEAIGPTAVQPAEWLAHWIRDKRDMCAGLQDCVQKYKLGLGGERVDKLVIAEVARLREARPNSEIRRVADNPAPPNL